ncbi:hypothetical protein ACHAXT_003798 [Thalassiosira profunda]
MLSKVGPDAEAGWSVPGIAVRLLAVIALFGAYALGWVRAMAVRPTATSSIDIKQTLKELSELTGLLDKVIDTNVTGATPLPVLYGHIHMAKTGGTSLNGLLANKFERVCGHKGYSYDAYADNERAKKEKEAGKRVTTHPFGQEWSRSRVNPAVMKMTGYENCDYISHEESWSFWKTKFGEKRFHGMAMELHVPCRSPIDHLMSQCNFRHKALRCAGLSDEEFFRAIDSCMVMLDRFGRDLLNSFTVRCFDFRQQFTKYIDHMAGILQRRRLESTPYIKRETNRPRNKTSECIWGDQPMYAKAEAYLISKYDYYKFCDKCMGSADEITRNTTITD